MIERAPILMTVLVNMFALTEFNEKLLNLLCLVFKEAEDDRMCKFSNPILKTIQGLLLNEAIPAERLANDTRIIKLLVLILQSMETSNESDPETV